MGYRMKKINILKLLSLIFALTFISQMLYGCGGKEDFLLPTRKIPESAESLTFGSYTYQVYDDNTIILTSYSGSEINVTIPKEIDGKQVIALGHSLFVSSDILESVVIGDNIETIGNEAFFCCTKLNSVSIGKNVWSVGVLAFDETPWLSSQSEDFIIVGDGVLIKYNGTSKTVTIPEKVKHLSSAFYVNGKVVSVVMGDQVLTIGENAFADCGALTYVKMSKNIKSIGSRAFEKCVFLTGFDIPNSCEYIGSFAFNSCYSFTTVRIGTSVKKIGEYAFAGCLHLRSLTLPSSLSQVGEYAFTECSSIIAVFYAGTENDFESIGLDDTNYLVKDAYKFYDVTGGIHEATK